MEYNSFDKEPIIKVDYKNKKKPFRLMNNVYYLSGAYEGLESYGIRINKGYNWNGANIPRFLWRIVGSQYNPEFLPASMVHDWLCENKDFILADGVKISSLIFRDILVLSGVSKFKANIMMSAVWAFQLTRKGWN
jgi:hypothetical protein